MVRLISKRIRSSSSPLTSGKVMKISLIVSLCLHVLILLVFRNAFPFKWKESDLKTYEVELMRPPVEDLKNEADPDAQMERPKKPEAPPPEESQETISLDTQDKRYITYATMLREMISSHWRYPAEAKDRLLEGNLTVLFSLSKRGDLIQIGITHNSGYEILDNEAIRAVRMAAPFPPFPQSIRVGRLNVKATFVYQLTAKK